MTTPYARRPVTVPTNVRLPKELSSRATDYCDKNMLTVAALIRLALTEYLERRPDVRA